MQMELFEIKRFKKKTRKLDEKSMPEYMILGGKWKKSLRITHCDRQIWARQSVWESAQLTISAYFVPEKWAAPSSKTLIKF